MGITEGPQAVYRHYSEREQLLYVGRSVNPDDRWRRLKIQYPEWTCWSVRRDDTWYPSWHEAKTAELVAIHTESPLFNIQGARGRWESFVGSTARMMLADGSVLELAYTGHRWTVLPEAEAEIREIEAIRAQVWSQ